MQTIEKLEKTVDAGNYYEAQQMYKSISARYAEFPFLYSHLHCIIKLFLDWKCSCGFSYLISYIKKNKIKARYEI